MFTTVYIMQNCAWIVVYTIYSAQNTIPWRTCSPSYNSKYCYTQALQSECTRTSNYSIYFDFRCRSPGQFCAYHGFANSNGTHCFNKPQRPTGTYQTNVTDDWPVAGQATPVGHVGRRLISQRDFFYYFVRDRPSNHTRAGLKEHRRAVFTRSYLLAWLLALLPCFSVWLSSWVAVLLVLLSPVVVLLLLCRVLIFPGSWAGIANFFYGRAHLATLIDLNCWVDAISMAYWSVNIGGGLNPALSSRNRLRHNALLSSVIVVFSDLAFGVLNSMVLFSVRGTLEVRSAFMYGELLELDDDPQALTFVAFTTVVEMMPHQRFWGVIYFGTMLGQTVGSVAMVVIALGLSLVDAVPFFGHLAFPLAALTAYSPALLLGAVVGLGTWFGSEWSCFSLFQLQWIVCNMLIAMVLGQKLSKPAFLTETRELLHQPLGRNLGRFFVVSWLVITPFITVFQMLYMITHFQLPPVRPGSHWLMALSWVAVSTPPLVTLVTTVVVCRSTNTWALFATTDQFRPDPQALVELQSAATIGLETYVDQTSSGKVRGPRSESAASPSQHEGPRTELRGSSL
ncbi:sodium- and chloride-dependent neutral and basic amino acid transporter B(0+)-like [Pollicipes pollicipes]|uniref:sodium- and chloride-dependent neutral and basic amino acid transporter B(0+)-like n=1 Tax=Pollicipes pollicipes TaxID=41117 RepID=UPI0018855102|nr:sodium- and chloride-dependent neutral and basic amino acid transporter B(0+)-like [Pollicipes pollicipes]